MYEYVFFVNIFTNLLIDKLWDIYAKCEVVLWKDLGLLIFNLCLGSDQLFHAERRILCT